MNKLWAVPIAAPGMDELVKAHCLGDCGKALLGMLVSEIGPLVPCKQELCPFEENTLHYGEFQSENETYDVTLRKLRP